MQLVLTAREIRVARSTFRTLALILETSIFAEWPVLKHGWRRWETGAQKEVILAVFRGGNCQLGFKSTPLHTPTGCTPDCLPLLGEVCEALKDNHPHVC